MNPHDDPYRRPSFGLANRVGRALWGTVWLLFFRYSPKPMHAWRRLLLRLCGARIGPACAIHPRVRIWAPWHLTCADTVAIADGVEIYNPAHLTLRTHAIVSQGAYLCGATHDYNDPAFPLISGEIDIGAYAWICARSTVLPGVQVGDGAVLGLGAVASRDLAPWTVYAGLPAREIATRKKP